MRKKYARTNIIVLILCFVVIFGCNRQTEQEKISKVITTIQKAAEEKNVKKVVNSLSKAYNDPQGFNYETIRGLLLGYFFRHQKLHVYITNLDIIVEDTSAKAVFQAVLSGGNETGSDILPEALGMYAFDVLLKKEEGDWKVASARWNQINENRQ